MKHGSLRLRLLAAGAASILVALTVAGFGLMLLFERHVERRIVAELRTDLRQLVTGLALTPDGALEVSRLPSEPRFQEPLSGIYWQIVPQDGGPAVRSRSLWDTVLSLPADDLWDGQEHHHDIAGPDGTRLLAVERGVVLPARLGGGRVRVVVALDHREVTAAVRAFGADLLPALSVLAVVLILAAWAQVTIGLWPLDTVRRRLADVREGRTPRLGQAFPDEVQPLALEVDALLDAQAAALAKARARAADLAHGLKTPLTVLAATADDMRRHGDAAAAADIASVADSMRRHVERELVRARVGHGGLAVVRHAVRPVADRVIGVLRRTPRGQDLGWQVAVPPDLAVAMDPQDLAELLGNLVENAVAWARSRVSITGAVSGEQVALSVEDDGPGIADDDVAAALARGGRLDESRPGSGLGLAIVNDLAEAYGGTVLLRRSATLNGLHASVCLPVRRSAQSVP